MEEKDSNGIYIHEDYKGGYQGLVLAISEDLEGYEEYAKQQKLVDDLQVFTY